MDYRHGRSDRKRMLCVMTAPHRYRKNKSGVWSTWSKNRWKYMISNQRTWWQGNSYLQITDNDINPRHIPPRQILPSTCTNSVIHKVNEESPFVAKNSLFLFLQGLVELLITYVDVRDSFKFIQSSTCTVLSVQSYFI
mmetsp:Transcript_33961/g.81636  ORF Transcript_33961/g.81636 Transcript_33961/m.81636 type:complete len:138 (+) Transcript_33961:530-943(+)